MKFMTPTLVYGCHVAPMGLWLLDMEIGEGSNLHYWCLQAG